MAKQGSGSSKLLIAGVAIGGLLVGAFGTHFLFPASHFQPPRIISITGPSNDSVYTAARAFDRSPAPNAFWEVTMKGPVELALAYDKPITVQSYTLQAGVERDRMPSDWQLQASQGGGKWVTVDTQSGHKTWTAGGVMTFKVAKPQPASSYRFIFASTAGSPVLRVQEIELRSSSAQ